MLLQRCVLSCACAITVMRARCVRCTHGPCHAWDLQTCAMLLLFCISYVRMMCVMSASCVRFIYMAPAMFGFCKSAPCCCVSQTETRHKLQQRRLATVHSGTPTLPQMHIGTLLCVRFLRMRKQGDACKVYVCHTHAPSHPVNTWAPRMTCPLRLCSSQPLICQSCSHQGRAPSPHTCYLARSSLVNVCKMLAGALDACATAVLPAMCDV